MWSDSPFNTGASRLAFTNGGIPRKQPLWRLLKATKYGVMYELCIADGTIYANSMGQIIYAISASDGRMLWQTEVPRPIETLSIACTGKYVFVAPFVMDSASGEVVYDARESDPALKYNENASSGVVADGLFVWNPFMGEEEGIQLIDPATWEPRFFPIRLQKLYSWPGNNIAFALDGKNVAAIDVVSGSVLWQVPVPMAKNGDMMVPSQGVINIKDRVYLHVNKETLWCLSASDGRFLWKSGPDEIADNDKPFQSRPPSDFFATEDRIYLGKSIYEGHLRCYSASNGEELWRIPVNKARFGPIAGDLIFGVLSDVPVAWDRYTGERVWHAEKGALATVFAAADDNKVIYTTTTSGMYCYEWEEEYVSPASPKS